jgi:hypothetical protein
MNMHVILNLLVNFQSNLRCNFKMWWKMR